MFGTILSYLTAVLVLYYIGLICLDLFIKPTAPPEESGKPEEAEIDISDEAGSFKAVEIQRDNHSRKAPGKKAAMNESLSREPVMTNGIPVEQLVNRARNISKTEDVELLGLGMIVAKCEAAA